MSNQRLVSGLQASPAVNQQQHHISLRDSRHGLARHRSVYTRLFTRDTAGIDDDEAGLFDATLSVLSIAGQPG